MSTDTGKLKKSVILPAPKIPSLGKVLALVSYLFALSLLANVLMIAQCSHDSEEKESWAHSYYLEKSRREDLQQKLDLLPGSVCNVFTQDYYWYVPGRYVLQVGEESMDPKEYPIEHPFCRSDENSPISVSSTFFLNR